MLRLCPRAIAFTAMIICLPVTAQAADTRLMLVCQGTRTYKTYQPDQKGEPNPISIGVIVNLTEGTVTGLDDEPPLKIQNVTGTAITFGMNWSSNDGQTVKGTLGKLDRLTGDMSTSQRGRNRAARMIVEPPKHLSPASAGLFLAKHGLRAT